MSHLEAHNVIQLQQELLDKERKLQSAIGIAGLHQARMLSLEERIDDKKDVKEKVAKQIEKEEQNKRETALQQDNEKHQQDNADLRRFIMSDLRDRPPDNGRGPIGSQGLGMILREKGAVDYEALHGSPAIQREQKEEQIDPDDDNLISIGDSMEEEEPIEVDEVSNDDVDSEMDETAVKVEDSFEETSFNNDESAQMLEPSNLFDDDINIDGEMGVDKYGNIVQFGGNVLVDSMDDMVQREEVMENTVGNPKDSSVDGDIELRTNGRPSRRASKSVKYTDSLEASDADEAPPVKKSRTKDEKKREKKRKSSNKDKESPMNVPTVPKLNKTELKCPECEYRSRSVIGWQSHLRKIHSTTLVLAGLGLRCDCGVESFSDTHFRNKKCEIASATVIRKSDMMKEPRVAKLNNTELECPKCEYRGRSVMGWVLHLRSDHSTTPTMAGLALRCGCGHEGFSDAHSRTCHSTNTTIISKREIKKKVTPQCVLCETYPTTLRGYCEHIQRHHQTNLNMSGIYLMCNCAFKVVSKHCLTKHKKECDGCHFTLHKINED